MRQNWKERGSGNMGWGESEKRNQRKKNTGKHLEK